MLVYLNIVNNLRVNLFAELIQILQRLTCKFLNQVITLKRKDPGWKNTATMPWPCHDHTVIMAKHGHDHTMMTTWQLWFLAWSSWFIAWSCYDYHVFHDSYHDHGMISMFSMFFLEKINCMSIFSQIVVAIYRYMAYLTSFRGIPNCRVNKIERMLLQR